MVQAVRAFFTPLLLVLIASQSELQAQSNSVTANEQQNRFVEVQNVQLRAKPQLWAPGVINLKYGDEVTVIEKAGAWVRVHSVNGAEGYLHQSAITERKVILEGNTQNRKIDSGGSDIVLAGKGFNANVAALFATDRKDLNYTAVDQVQQLQVSPTELEHFLSAGQLSLISDS